METKKGTSVRINIYLTEEHIKFVDEQAKKWGMRSRAAYINYLIEKEQQRVLGK